MNYEENYKPLPKFLLGLFCILAFFATFLMAESLGFSRLLALLISFLMAFLIYLIHRD